MKQTALSQGIARKTEKLQKLIDMQIKEPTAWKADMMVYLREEISEDEKLLEVEEADRNERDRRLIDITWSYAYEDEQVPSTLTQSEIIVKVNQTYQTDGK